MKSVFTFIIVVLFTQAYSQYAEPEEKQDSVKVTYLEEMVISANKIPEQRRAVAQQIKIITPTFIKNFNAQTTSDLLQNTGLVAMQRSQQGGGSPMMRGFEASRILLMVDGVRMNNLIYRAGHLQNVITMDNNILDRAEVLFGPSSTVYGSDALGGVVHFYSRNPELAQENKTLFLGNLFTRFGNVNNESTTHLDVNLSGKKFGSLTSFTYSDFGDLRMGKKTSGKDFGLRTYYAQRKPDNSGDSLVANQDPHVQKFSGYQQYDVMQKFLYKPSDQVQHLLNFQFSTSSNIPRYDRLTDPQGAGLRSAEWYYGPQKRLMASYQLSVKGLGAIADALTATASYQSIEESRHDRRFNSNNLNHRIENVDVSALTIDLQKNMGAHKLRYGFDSQFNKLVSTAHRRNISTGVVTPLDTRYPDGDNTMDFLAVYATHTWELSDRWIVNDGIRFGGSSLNSTFVDDSFFAFPFDDIKQTNTFGSGNLGIIFTPTSWKFSLMGSTGYRVPNIDDLAKVFESVVGSASTTGLLVVPNSDLKPEKTINADLAITKFFGDKLRLEGVLFATQFFDAIATRPSTLNGQSTISYSGFPADVVSSQNVNQAYLYGWNAQLRADLSEAWAITGSYNYTYGRLKPDSGPETPMDHIAPQFGRVGISYSTKGFKTELFSNFSGKKYLSGYSNSGEDNLQYAPANGMPSWYTINWRLSYDLGDQLTVQTGVDNLLDLQYRTFASGINSPGRNLFATVRVKF
jgi:hemoglobin/transferrin/lactoferrin receptor protein